jgi:hypothetical protein
MHPMLPPPRAVLQGTQAKLLPVLEKTKEAYKLWHEIHNTLPKTHRYSLGIKADTLFIDLIESLAVATFLSKEEKLPFVRIGMRKLDTVNVLLIILFETKSLDIKKYIALSEKTSEIGRMLGGWHGQLIKQIMEKKN